jgi:hypothetical protein
MPMANQVRVASSGTEEFAQPWEVGGFFGARELTHEETIPWPQPNVFFALARHVVPGILRVNSSTCRLWIPDYFCPDVIAYWSGLVETVSYHDDPSWPEPDWKSLTPDKHDLVVAVNYFGVRAKEPWEHWRSRHHCVLLEDHSHDPVSSWALTSKAEYAFSSLRKSMPITDGAICWSPTGLRLPRPGTGKPAGIELKLAAMGAKANFLAGRTSTDSKALYRDWYFEGDSFLEEGPEAPISDRAMEFVRSGVPIPWRKARECNVRHLLNSITQTQKNAKPLFMRWPTKSVPFAVVMVFPSRKDRDSCRLYLEAHNVFCPVHWPLVQAESNVSDLCAKILSIPADQRYGDADMARVAKILARWKPGKISQ